MGDSYIVMNMRDFEANARGTMNGYQARFCSSAFRDYEREEVAARQRKRRPSTPSGRPPSLASTSQRDEVFQSLAVPTGTQRAARRQAALCQRLALPTDVQRAREKFTIEGFLQG